MSSSRTLLQNLLTDGIQRLSLKVDSNHIDTLLNYLDLLVRWNRAFNLTAVRYPPDMVTRHLLDSLAILPWAVGKTAVDLGSGAGLPGLILAIVNPEQTWLLVDSNGKKARFLRAAKRELGLNNVEVAQSRVEAINRHFDLVTARAFTSMENMLSLAGHVLAANGTWLAMKGQYPKDELAQLPAAFTVKQTIPLQIPGLDGERHLVSIQHHHDGNAG